MIVRIVKMEFYPENVSEFLSIFETVKENIRTFKGCLHLELLQGTPDDSIFFTYSKWNDTKALEEYRNSELFKSVWIPTKKLFRCKAQAWSTSLINNNH